MIISRAPFRISYVGGGTDFEDYYKLDYGQVISASIDKYIYVIINKKFDKKIHLRYSQFECVDNIDELKHDLVREAMRMSRIKRGVEIVIVSDIPSKGSGLGSSSSLAVALLNGFARYNNVVYDKTELVEMACKLEIDILKKPIGKQDHYACCFGGLNRITFKVDDIRVETLFEKKEVTLNKLHWINHATMLFYLGDGRSSSDILCKHKSNISEKKEVLDRQSELVPVLMSWFEHKMNYEYAGELVNQSWECKKAITPDASSDKIDNIISKILEAGACGAKVCGAGGGGFCMVLCDIDKQENVRSVFKNFKELRFNFDRKGASSWILDSEY